MNKYQRGKIYKIVSDLTDDVYIGSTTEPTLARRLVKHKGNYKEYLEGQRRFITSFKILQTGNYDIVLLESYPCNSKDELHKKEREYIENTPNCVNKVIPTRTKREHSKVYREKNKAKISARRRELCICECGSEHIRDIKARHLRTQKHQNYIKSLTE